jgi:hypothetical protein
MGKIGNLAAGNNVDTIFSAQTQLEEFLQIGAFGDDNPVKSISIEIDGTSFINIKNANQFIQAWGMWLMGADESGSNQGGTLMLSTGKIQRPTTITLTNSGDTTPPIYAYSDSSNGVPFLVTATNINESSYADYDKFSALFLASDLGLDYAEIVFSDGHKAKLTAAELNSYYARFNPNSEGQINGLTVIDNTRQNISQVRLYTAEGASLTVYVVKLPNEAFPILKQNLG